MLSGNANSFNFLWFAANLFTKIDVIPATRIAATAGMFAIFVKCGAAMVP